MSTEYTICPVCKDRVQKIFENNKERLEYDKAKVLEKLKQGYEKYREKVEEVLSDEEQELAWDLQRELEKKIMPVENNFHTVRLDKEISLHKTHISIFITAECNTCETIWKIDKNFPTK